MKTVYGIICDELGLASKETLAQGTNGPELRRRAWATPAAEVRSTQPARIPVDRDHDHRWAGQLIYLELRSGNLWAVAHVDDDVGPTVNVTVGNELRHVETPLYWSATRRGGEDWGIEILSVALTAFPARVAPRPVAFRPGDVALAAFRSSDSTERELLKRAAAAHRTRRVGDPLHVRDHDAERLLDQRSRDLHPAEVAQLLEDQYYDRRPPGPIEWRPGRILSVR